MNTIHTAHIFKLLIGAVILALIMIGIYFGSKTKNESNALNSTTTSSDRASHTALDTLPTAFSYKLSVNTKDDAVSAYLKEAQLHAEIYKFTNNGMYNGMCELTDKNDLFNLELGVLRYIKAVGATGVYCATSDTSYMIEAKLPGNGKYFCIDSSGFAGEQDISHQKDHTCAAR